VVVTALTAGYRLRLVLSTPVFPDGFS